MAILAFYYVLLCRDPSALEKTFKNAFTSCLPALLGFFQRGTSTGVNALRAGSRSRFGG